MAHCGKQMHISPEQVHDLKNLQEMLVRRGGRPEEKEDQGEPTSAALAVASTSPSTTTSLAASSASLRSPSLVSSHASSPSISPSQEAHSSTTPVASRPRACKTDVPQQKVLSCRFPGTGVFVFRREPCVGGGGGEGAVRLPYKSLSLEDQQLMRKEAYDAILAVCEAMVPHGGLELMDALMETTDVYRKRYGFKKDLFGLRRKEKEKEGKKGGGSSNCSRGTTSSSKCSNGSGRMRHGGDGGGREEEVEEEEEEMDDEEEEEGEEEDEGGSVEDDSTTCAGDRRGSGGGGWGAAADPFAFDNLTRLTPPLRMAKGSFWVRRDKNRRKKRCAFILLARSQRARLVKSAYELVQAVGEEFSPGGTRLDLLDRIFEHHTKLRPIPKKMKLPTEAYPHLFENASESALKRRRGAAGSSASPLDDPLFNAAAHVLASHWAQSLFGSSNDVKVRIDRALVGLGTAPPPLPASIQYANPPPVQTIGQLVQEHYLMSAPLTASAAAASSHQKNSTQQTPTNTHKFSGTLPAPPPAPAPAPAGSGPFFPSHILKTGQPQPQLPLPISSSLLHSLSQSHTQQQQEQQQREIKPSPYLNSGGKLYGGPLISRFDMGSDSSTTTTTITTTTNSNSQAPKTAIEAGPPPPHPSFLSSSASFSSCSSSSLLAAAAALTERRDENYNSSNNNNQGGSVNTFSFPGSSRPSSTPAQAPAPTPAAAGFPLPHTHTHTQPAPGPAPPSQQSQTQTHSQALLPPIPTAQDWTSLLLRAAAQRRSSPPTHTHMHIQPNHQFNSSNATTTSSTSTTSNNPASYAFNTHTHTQTNAPAPLPFSFLQPKQEQEMAAAQQMSFLNTHTHTQPPSYGLGGRRGY